MLHIGVAEGVINPSKEVELGGYNFGIHQGILDDLQAQVLVIKHDNLTAVMIALDVLLVSNSFVSSLREKIQSATGIPTEAVLVAASHSHSSPTLHPLRQWGAVNAYYATWLQDELLQLVITAAQKIQPVSMLMGSAELKGLSENRREKSMEPDFSLPVLRFDSELSETLALLFSFGCHPVTLHSYKNLLSPDYPGCARDVLRQEFGTSVIPLFLLGPSGDINPAGYTPGQTSPQYAQTIGNALGHKVVTIARNSVSEEIPTLHVFQKMITLPLAVLPSQATILEMQAMFTAEIDQLRRDGADWSRISVQEIKRDWASELLAQQQSGSVPTSLDCEIQLIWIGKALIVAAPFELFSQTGLAIKNASPAALTIISSNSNGACGYLPTEDAYDDSDYTNPQGLAPKVYGWYAFDRTAESIFRQQVNEFISESFEKPK